MTSKQKLVSENIGSYGFASCCSSLEYKTAFEKMISDRTWQWLVTINTPRKSNFDIYRKFYIWRSRICQQEHLQVGYVWITTPKTSYSLMVGVNKYSKSLLNVSIPPWENYWDNWNDIKNLSPKYFPPSSCKITLIIPTFHIGNLLPDKFFWRTSNPKFLKRFLKIDNSPNKEIL